MKITKATHLEDSWLVSVDPNELVVASGKKLPYATTIGVFNVRGTLKVWTPAAYKPQGYADAAREMLRKAWKKTV